MVHRSYVISNICEARYVFVDENVSKVFCHVFGNQYEKFLYVFVYV